MQTVGRCLQLEHLVANAGAVLVQREDLEVVVDGLVWVSRGRRRRERRRTPLSQAVDVSEDVGAHEESPVGGAGFEGILRRLEPQHNTAAGQSFEPNQHRLCRAALGDTSEHGGDVAGVTLQVVGPRGIGWDRQVEVGLVPLVTEYRKWEPAVWTPRKVPACAVPCHEDVPRDGDGRARRAMHHDNVWRFDTPAAVSAQVPQTVCGTPQRRQSWKVAESKLDTRWRLVVGDPGIHIFQDSHLSFPGRASTRMYP
jgi:hypothetical protein